MFRPVVPSVVVVSSPDPHRRHHTALLIAFPRATVSIVIARPSSAASYCSANSLSSRDRLDFRHYASPPRRGCKVFRRPLRRYFVDRRRQCRRRRIRRSHCISSSTSRQNCYYHNANDEDDWTTQKEFNCKKANRVSFFETLVSKDSRYVLRVKNLCRNIHVGIHLHGQTDGQTT